MGRRPKQIFFQRHTDGNRNVKKMLNITNYQRNANQITIRYHLTQIRMVIINNSTNNKCWRGCGQKGTLLYWRWGCKLAQPLWRTVWRYLRKLNIELQYDSEIPLLTCIQIKLSLKMIHAPLYLIAAIFTIAKTWKQHKCPLTDELIKIMWYIYTMEYYSAIKKTN